MPAQQQAVDVMWHFPTDTMNKLSLTIRTLTFSLLLSCKSHYNDTIHWVDNIKIGSDISLVKRTQPNFVTIDWTNSDTINKVVRYKVTKIKGDNDILKMAHYLIFIDNKYQGRQSHK